MSTRQHTLPLLAALLLSPLVPIYAIDSRDAVPSVQRIYIIHFSHTDVGFTDMPGVCRELQRRYLDIALDGVLATMSKPDGERFHWTCESLMTVDDWWEAASPARREDFLKALRSGQLEVAALPCNQTPFLDAAQWRTMLHWVPDDLWRQFQPTVAVQNDVNGFPRAGAVALLAWRPMGQAEWLLSQRARSRLLREGEGLFVANPSRRPFTGF